MGDDVVVVAIGRNAHAPVRPGFCPGGRLLVMRTSGLAVLPLTLAGCIVEAPRQTNAPVQQQRRASGIMDQDPNDGPGNGRGTQRRSSGITDQDPNDGPGNGRGTQQRRASGITDQDPNDGPGNGRGTQPVRRNTGLTDSDPNDGPGSGRSGR